VSSLLSKNNTLFIDRKMKKNNYLSPEMEVVEMKVQGMLCISGDGDGSTSNPNNPVSGDEEIEI